MEQRATYLSEMHSQLRTVNLELEHLEREIEVLLSRQQELLDRKALIEEQIAEEASSPPATSSGVNDDDGSIDWSSTNFSWTEKVDTALKHVFHISGFRKLQRETINATLSGMDCLLIMPTGGGKSLCYQLPAVVSDGFTLVVSPLVSLMEDQILALHELEINAALLNANSTREHVNHVHGEMTNQMGTTKLIYVTPEKIAKSKRFMTKLEKGYEAGLLTRIVIDEVHCTSQWGHDFRPDYKFLNILKRQFPRTPILGLTATATSKVLIDVKKILNLQKGCLLFRASFNRPNLMYEVITSFAPPSSTINEIAVIIKNRFPNQSGIVYCFSRKDSETVTTELQKRGIKAGCYHADLSQDVRSKVHYGWLKDKIQVVVATVAFGMGIDKPNVRFVIHFSISKSMENFYQESGRAGRDDKPATCLLYFKFSDAFRQSTMVFTEQTGLSNLYGMLEYCLDIRTCRRKLIGSHFEEKWDPANCNQMCDNCKRGREAQVVDQDVTGSAMDVLTIVRHAAGMKERITPLKLVEAWLGKGASNLRVASVKEPSFSRVTCERILLTLLIKEVLREEFHFTPYSTISYIVEGPRAALVQNKGMKIFIHVNLEKVSSSKEVSLAPKNPPTHTAATFDELSIGATSVCEGNQQKGKTGKRSVNLKNKAKQRKDKKRLGKRKTKVNQTAFRGLSTASKKEVNFTDKKNTTFTEGALMSWEDDNYETNLCSLKIANAVKMENSSTLPSATPKLPFSSTANRNSSEKTTNLASKRKMTNSDHDIGNEEHLSATKKLGLDKRLGKMGGKVSSTLSKAGDSVANPVVVETECGDELIYAAKASNFSRCNVIAGKKTKEETLCKAKSSLSVPVNSVYDGAEAFSILHADRNQSESDHSGTFQKPIVSSPKFKFRKTTVKFGSDTSS